MQSQNILNQQKGAKPQDCLLLKSQQMMDIIDKKDEDLNKSVELSEQEEEILVLQEGEMNLKNSVMPDIIQPKIGNKQDLLTQADQFFLQEDVKDKVLESQVYTTNNMTTTTVKESTIENQNADLAKVQYCMKLESQENADLSDATKIGLRELMNMGFLDFEKNKKLLTENVNNVDLAVSHMFSMQ